MFSGENGTAKVPLYSTSGEATVGDAVIEADEAAATLPQKAQVLIAAGGADAEVGKFLIGVGIGDGIGELDAFPPVPEHNGLFDEPAPFYETESTRNFHIYFEYLPMIGVYPEASSPSTCESILPENRILRAAELASFEAHGVLLTDHCEHSEAFYEEWSTWEEFECKSGCHWVPEETKRRKLRYGTTSGLPPQIPCPANWTGCYNVRESEYQELTRGYVDDKWAQPAAFPAPNINTLKTASESEAYELGRQEALKVRRDPSLARCSP